MCNLPQHFMQFFISYTSVLKTSFLFKLLGFSSPPPWLYSFKYETWLTYFSYFALNSSKVCIFQRHCLSVLLQQTARPGRCSGWLVENSRPTPPFLPCAGRSLYFWVLQSSTGATTSRPQPFHFFLARGQRLHPMETPGSHAARDRCSSPFPTWGGDASFAEAVGAEQLLPFPGNPPAAPGWERSWSGVERVTLLPWSELRRVSQAPSPTSLYGPKPLDTTTLQPINIVRGRGGEAAAAAAAAPLPPPGCKLCAAHIPKETNCPAAPSTCCSWTPGRDCKYGGGGAGRCCAGRFFPPG